VEAVQEPIGAEAVAEYTVEVPATAETAEALPEAPELDLGPTEPGPPSWDALAPPPRSQEPEDALEALTDPGEGAASPLEIPDAPAIEIEEPPVEDAAASTRAAAELEALAPPPEADADPFAGAPGGDIPFDVPDALSPDQLVEEELVASPPPPSWDDITQQCMSLAHAKGALLADNDGKLISVAGEWPDPGPEAIASRLVAMMERTLRDAPTRSVSAPVGHQHLTAWRVPVGERLVTTAFLAEVPVRADHRPPIDAAIQGGAGA
jgi:hypothetical protein